MERRRRNAHDRDTQPASSGDAPQGAFDADRIARRAYQRFEERGGEPGRDLEDWLEAERELMNLESDK